MADRQALRQVELKKVADSYLRNELGIDPRTVRYTPKVIDNSIFGGASVLIFHVEEEAIHGR